jgi:hypothetical protein
MNRIIPPNRKQPAPWEKEIFGGAETSTYAT